MYFSDSGSEAQEQSRTVINGPGQLKKKDKRAFLGEHLMQCGVAIPRCPWERCCIVVWFCPLTSGNSVDALNWDCKGPQWVKGHFKD